MIPNAKTDKPRPPAQSQLDEERAVGEGMVQPEVEKETASPPASRPRPQPKT